MRRWVVRVTGRHDTWLELISCNKVLYSCQYMWKALWKASTSFLCVPAFCLRCTWMSKFCLVPAFSSLNQSILVAHESVIFIQNRIRNSFTPYQESGPQETIKWERLFRSWKFAVRKAVCPCFPATQNTHLCASLLPFRWEQWHFEAFSYITKHYCY